MMHLTASVYAIRVSPSSEFQSFRTCMFASVQPLRPTTSERGLAGAALTVHSAAERANATKERVDRTILKDGDVKELSDRMRVDVIQLCRRREERRSARGGAGFSSRCGCRVCTNLCARRQANPACLQDLVRPDSPENNPSGEVDRR